MSKETRKFQIKVAETIITTHEVEVPISFLDQHPQDDIKGVVHKHYDEFIKEPDYKSKTLTDVEFGWDTDVEVEEITDE